MQHGRPEQRVEIQNVLADEMHELGVGTLFPDSVEVDPLLIGERLEGTHVADRRVEPDVKIFARGIGNSKTEIRRVTRDIPVAEFVFASVT